MEENQPNEFKSFIICIVALVIVGVASLAPWSRWTGGVIKDFNLIGDITVGGNAADSTAVSQEEIDPELLAAQQESRLEQLALADAGDTIIQPAKQPRVNGMTVIEDYTSGNHGLSRLKAALAAKRLARVAFVGDSYLEGDIFSEYFRAKMQETYGGGGVGFVYMQTEVGSNFRQTVKQEGKGWKIFTAKEHGDQAYLGLSEQYAIPEGPATSTYEGSEKMPCVAKWNTSKFMFISPTDATISMKTGTNWRDYHVKGSPNVQCLEIKGSTADFAVKTANTRLVSLGVWINDSTGVAVDCMSSRGISGMSLSKLSPELCAQSRKYIDYDLIILEFGINAMSASQTDYHIYSQRISEVVVHLRKCYPRADILLLSIGDRGERRGSSVQSMAACAPMVTAQRDAARRAHCLFWDTRDAMGGNNAIVNWSSNGLANKDYVHLTHKGGEKLGTALFNAIQQILK